MHKFQNLATNDHGWATDTRANHNELHLHRSWPQLRFWTSLSSNTLSTFLFIRHYNLSHPQNLLPNNKFRYFIRHSEFFLNYSTTSMTSKDQTTRSAEANCSSLNQLNRNWFTVLIPCFVLRPLCSRHTGDYYDRRRDVGWMEEPRRKHVEMLQSLVNYCLYCCCVTESTLREPSLHPAWKW